VDVYEDMEDFGPDGFQIRMDDHELDGEEDGVTDSHARTPIAKPAKKEKRRNMNISALGVEYPPFPKRVIKKLAEQYAGTNISNETLKALQAATDKFFEQASVDMGAYARHAGRKTIDDLDALLMFKRHVFFFRPSIVQDCRLHFSNRFNRQRRVNPHTTLFSLAQKHLPRELSQHIRMPMPPKSRGKRPAKT